MKGSALRQLCEYSKMMHDLKPMSLYELWSLQAVAVSGRIDTAALVAKFRAQRQRTEQLNEYYKQIVAEIRVSIDQPQAEG